MTWHYQWIIVHEFLPAIIGAPLVSDILNRGRRFYRPNPGEQSIPVEFQGAAYRFGHSLVRPSYRANLLGDNGLPFFGFIFDPVAEGQPDPEDLRGGARAARRFIGWQTFFDFGGAQTTNVRPNKILDTKISTPLFNLPLGAIPSGDRPTSLPQRNLLRHLTWSIPSGQSIARAMNIRPLTPEQLNELAFFGADLERSTPLWYYVLKEAELAGGQRLAGVGARIVGEVFLGLLAADSRFVSVAVAVAPDASQPGAGLLRDSRPPDVRTGRSGKPRAVSSRRAKFCRPSGRRPAAVTQSEAVLSAASGTWALARLDGAG